MLLSLLSSIAITIGRVGFGHPEWAINSRYITITSPGIAGMYMLALRFSREVTYSRAARVRYRLLLFAIIFLILQGLIITNIYGIRLGKMWYSEKLRAKYALQTIDIQPDNALKTLYPFPQ